MNNIIIKSLTAGIVIPLHSNASRIKWILDSLVPQLKFGDEIVIVDDHCTVLPELDYYINNFNIGLVKLKSRSGPGNRSAARNCGWKRTHSDIVIFLDGDMVPSPNFVEAVKSIYMTSDKICIKAMRFALTQAEIKKGKEYCLSVISEQKHWINEDKIDYIYHPDYLNTSSLINKSDKWYYAASNALSLKRIDVVNIGGWDEEFNGWGEEDMDFAYRLHLSGISFVFPEAETLYAVHLDHPVSDYRLTTLFRNALYFTSKFPEVYQIRLPAYEAFGLPGILFPKFRTNFRINDFKQRNNLINRFRRRFYFFKIRYFSPEFKKYFHN